MNKTTFHSASIADTAAFAKTFAAQAMEKLRQLDGRSLVVTLHGNLGAGKTAFTQCVAAALGVRRAVTSPTFCLVSEHPFGDTKLVHMDLYRLHDEDDVLSIGWEDYLSQGALMMVEWPDRAGDLIPPDAWRVEITATGDDERTIDWMIF